MKNRMKRSKFRVGNIVRLKSGGPNMKIVNIFGDDCVQVQWHSGPNDCDLNGHTLNPVVLMFVK